MGFGFRGFGFRVFRVSGSGFRRPGLRVDDGSNDSRESCVGLTTRMPVMLVCLEVHG